MVRKYVFTKTELENLLKKHGSFRKASLATGISRDTLKRHAVEQSIDFNKLEKPNLKRKVENYKPFTDQELIDQLHERNYFVTKDPQKQDYSFKGNLKPFEGDTYKIGVMGDTHLCSRYQQMTHLHTFYDYCEKQGITDIYNTGDITDGNGHVYRGQEFELFVYGADRQVDYTVKNYPERKGIKTHFICGNHDESHYKTSQLDIGKAIARRRKDMKYYGFYGAKVDLNGIKNLIYIHHGAGGGAYARCFDDKTEILTENGWKLFKDLKKQEKVATRSKNGYLEWRVPTEHFCYDYDDYLLYFKSRTFDLLVTPNHKLFTRIYPKRINRQSNLIMPTKSHRRLNVDWRLVEASDVIDCGNIRQRWQMNQEVLWEGKEEKMYTIPFKEKRLYASQEPKRFGNVDMDLWLEFLGWYVSEGFVEGKNNHKYVTVISQENEKYRKEIISLLNKLGWEYKVRKHCITIYGGELAEHLEEICGNGSYNKKAPVFIQSLTPRQIKVFLLSSLKGDGSYNKKLNKFTNYVSFSKKLRDDMQILFMKAGVGAYVSDKSVSIRYKQNLPTINKKPDKVRYKGKVYCVEVPGEHIIMVRRNGKAIWSGNSYNLQKFIEQMAPEQKPYMLFQGHYHTMCWLPMYRNVSAWRTPCFQSQTPYLKRKGLYPELGGLIVEFKIHNNKPTVPKVELIPFYVPKRDDY